MDLTWLQRRYLDRRLLYLHAWSTIPTNSHRRYKLANPHIHQVWFNNWSILHVLSHCLQRSGWINAYKLLTNPNCNHSWSTTLATAEISITHTYWDIVEWSYQRWWNKPWHVRCGDGWRQLVLSLLYSFSLSEYTWWHFLHHNLRRCCWLITQPHCGWSLQT